MLRNLDFVLESFRDPTKDFSQGDDMVIYGVQKVPSDFGEAGTLLRQSQTQGTA